MLGTALALVGLLTSELLTACACCSCLLYPDTVFEHHAMHEKDAALTLQSWPLAYMYMIKCFKPKPGAMFDDDSLSSKWSSVDLT
jgi:hypothetical protein